MEHVIKIRTCKEGVWCSYNNQIGLLAPSPAKGAMELRKSIKIQSGDTIVIKNVDTPTKA